VSWLSTVSSIAINLLRWAERWRNRPRPAGKIVGAWFRSSLSATPTSSAITDTELLLKVEVWNESPQPVTVSDWHLLVTIGELSFTPGVQEAPRKLVGSRETRERRGYSMAMIESLEWPLVPMPGSLSRSHLIGWVYAVLPNVQIDQLRVRSDIEITALEGKLKLRHASGHSWGPPLHIRDATILGDSHEIRTLPGPKPPHLEAASASTPDQ
jgi:hypothetical protein